MKMEQFPQIKHGQNRLLLLPKMDQNYSKNNARRLFVWKHFDNFFLPCSLFPPIISSFTIFLGSISQRCQPLREVLLAWPICSGQRCNWPFHSGKYRYAIFPSVVECRNENILKNWSHEWMWIIYRAPKILGLWIKRGSLEYIFTKRPFFPWASWPRLFRQIFGTI